MNKYGKVCAIVCHPDDELFMAGTLLNYHEEGYPVKVIYLSQGGGGHRTIAPDELKQIRMNEAKKANKIYGFDEPRFLNYPDHLAVDRDELIRALVCLVREEKPEIILTHARDDNQSPHAIAAQALTDAHNQFGSRLIEDAFGPVQVREIYYVCYEHCPVPQLQRPPHIYVDITHQMDTIQKAVLTYESQIETYQAKHLDIRGAVKADADLFNLKKRATIFAEGAWATCGIGKQIEVKYAEAFTVFAWTGTIARKLLPTHNTI